MEEEDLMSMSGSEGDIDDLLDEIDDLTLDDDEFDEIDEDMTDGLDEGLTPETKVSKKINYIFHKIFKALYLDLCIEFADSEEFLIDGDALLLHIVGENPNSRESSLSSLHIIYLLEKSLSLFQKRGGEFILVFFNANKSLWTSNTLLLLREVVIRHFRASTKIAVLTHFQTPFDEKFIEFVGKEKPCFILSTCGDTEVFEQHQQMTLFFIQYQNLGINFAELEEISKSMVSIFGWYSMSQPKSEKFANMVKDIFLQWAQTHSETELSLREDLEKLSENVPYGNIIESLANISLDEEENKAAKEALIYIAVVAEVLKSHCGIFDRIEPETYFCMSESSKMRGLVEFLTENMMGGLEHANKEKLSDVIDVQFLLRIAFIFRENASLPDAKASVADLFSKEVSEHGEILTDLKQLSNSFSMMDFTSTFSFGEGSLDDFDVEKKVVESVDEVKKCFLMKIDNPVYNCYTKDIIYKDAFEFLEGPDASPHVTDYKVFEEKYHWHVLKKLTDAYDRIPENKQSKSFFGRKNNQKNASFMVRYGTSIEGGIEIDKPIAVSESKKDTKHKEKSGGNKKSSVVKIQRENIKKKFLLQKEDLDTKYKAVKDVNVTNKLTDIATMFESKWKDIQKEIVKVGIANSNSKEKEKVKDNLEEDIKKYFEDRLTKLYLKLMKIHMASIKFEKDGDSSQEKVLFVLLLKKFMVMDTFKEDKNKETLSKYMTKLGFMKLASNLGLSGESKNSSESFARFQLENMGVHLDHDTPKERDTRVDKFNPDLWQRELFDVVDRRESALIIAPTSSGKTYASYYCMENVLRESNDGVVVYVSPTKALVNQVAATICARFSRRKTLPAGQSVYGIFTRDFRENTTNSQILVTVPECLEILLLSPERADWVSRVRYVVFDEVHNIGAESRGECWEHIMTMIRCPFLALSATVQNPEDLHGWLQNAENFKQQRDILDKKVDKVNRSYRVRLVPSTGKIQRHADLKKHIYTGKDDAHLTPLHPIAALKSSSIRKAGLIPSHIVMSPKECAELYDALEGQLGKKAVESINPTTMLGEKFLKKTDITMYNEKLKQFLLNVILSKEDSTIDVFENVQKVLLPVHKSKGDDMELDNEWKYMRSECKQLVSHLKKNDMLPAIIFAFNRMYCKEVPMVISKNFKQKIEDEKDSEEYEERKRLEEKNNRAMEKKNKKERAKMDKIESQKKDGKDDGGRQREDDDDSSALQKLNAVFNEFPQHTLVSKHTLGDDDAKFILSRLSRNTDVSNPQFLYCLQYGISWHHAGNNARMRNATEMLFREKFLNLVVATTTLAQGIHMPCKTVVFAGDSVFLNSLNYHQCAGRAGRRGFDQDGNVIFFGIKTAKISRLLNANLPKMIGNTPTSLSLILRLFILTSQTGREDVAKDAVSRALCMLEHPLIARSDPKIVSQLKFFFMYASEYLVRQNLIDTKGNPVGFAGLVSHLHYHEPYNLAFCHLLQQGVFHSMCYKNEKGAISDQTLRDLMVVVSFLFAREPLHPGYYEHNKKNFQNSKVLLPELPEVFKKCLQEFNDNIDQNFHNYLNSAAEIFKDELDDNLPISKEKHNLGKKDLGKSYDLVSPFSVLSGMSNSSIGKNDIQVIKSNIKTGLLTDTIPKISFDVMLNGFAVDFYNHGIWRCLITDNGIQEGNVFNLLNDFKFALKSIATSLQEMAPDQKTGESDDLVVQAFTQLSENFLVRFEEAFDTGVKYVPNGCNAIHTRNCQACDLLVEGTQIISLKGSKKFKIRDRFTCETTWVVYAITCTDCKTQFVGTTVPSSANKVAEILGSGEPFEVRHRGHNLLLSIIDGTNSGDFKGLNDKKIGWISKLFARDIDAR
jgi:superfamily II RNA helicase